MNANAALLPSSYCDVVSCGVVRKMRERSDGCIGIEAERGEEEEG